LKQFVAVTLLLWMNFSTENYSKICQIFIRREIKDHLYKGTDLILIKTRVKRSFYKGTKCFSYRQNILVCLAGFFWKELTTLEWEGARLLCTRYSWKYLGVFFHFIKSYLALNFPTDSFRFSIMKFFLKKICYYKSRG
jgi:hypothetical protein